MNGDGMNSDGTNDDRARDTAWTERWYRAMLLGYPAPYRERHGGELLGTLLEAHPARRLPSARESAHLLDAGLLTRLRTRLDAVPAWADGLQLGLLLLALVQAGSLLGRLATPQSPQPLILLPSLLLVAAILRGRMGIAAALGVIPAVSASYTALMEPGHGTDVLSGFFSSTSINVSAGVDFWLSGGPTQYLLIALGSAVLAVRPGGGPLPRRSWGWLAVPLLQAGCTAYGSTQLPATPGPGTVHPLPAFFGLPMIVTVGFLLLALRATAAIGDPRWAVAASVHLFPLAVSAAAIVTVRPGALVTLDFQLPSILLAAACALVLLRRAARRAVI